MFKFEGDTLVVTALSMVSLDVLGFDSDDDADFDALQGRIENYVTGAYECGLSHVDMQEDLRHAFRGEFSHLTVEIMKTRLGETKAMVVATAR
jgi:hypothetical protein